MKTMWLDTETTGLDSKKDRIVEIAVIFEDDCDKIQKYHSYIKYDKYPEGYERAFEINKLTVDFLEKNGKSESEVYEEIILFLDNNIDKFNNDDKCIIAGYYVDFDNNFLRNMFDRYNNKYFGSYFINCLLDVRSIIGDYVKRRRIKFVNYKLETICKVFNIFHSPHSALSDIGATRELYYKLTGGYHAK